jgi:hypothetical protein
LLNVFEQTAEALCRTLYHEHLPCSCVFCGPLRVQGDNQAVRAFKTSPANFSFWEKCLHTPQFDKDELYQSTITQFKPRGANSTIFFAPFTRTSFIFRSEPASVLSSGPQSLAIVVAPFGRKRGLKCRGSLRSERAALDGRSQLKLATRPAIFRRDLIRPFCGARQQRVELRSVFRQARGMSK